MCVCPSACGGHWWCLLGSVLGRLVHQRPGHLRSGAVRRDPGRPGGVSIQSGNPVLQGEQLLKDKSPYVCVLPTSRVFWAQAAAVQPPVPSWKRGQAEECLTLWIPPSKCVSLCVFVELKHCCSTWAVKTSFLILPLTGVKEEYWSLLKRKKNLIDPTVGKFRVCSIFRHLSTETQWRVTVLCLKCQVISFSLCMKSANRGTVLAWIAWFWTLSSQLFLVRAWRAWWSLHAVLLILTLLSSLAQAVERLVQGADSGCPSEKQRQTVLNCTRLLTRVLPYIFEDADWRGFFWSTVPGAGRAKVRLWSQNRPVGDRLSTAWRLRSSCRLHGLDCKPSHWLKLPSLVL